MSLKRCEPSSSYAYRQSMCRLVRGFVLLNRRKRGCYRFVHAACEVYCVGEGDNAKHVAEPVDPADLKKPESCEGVFIGDLFHQIQ